MSGADSARAKPHWAQVIHADADIGTPSADVGFFVPLRFVMIPRASFQNAYLEKHVFG